MINIKKIVLIDDNPCHLRLCEAIFKERGYHVYTLLGCREMAEIMTILHQFKPDLIFIDHIMPGICGTEITKQLKKHPASKHIPIIYFSGESDLIRLANKAGADSYLFKPYAITDLMEVTERYIN